MNIISFDMKQTQQVNVQGSAAMVCVGFKRKKNSKDSNDLIVCVFVRGSSFMPQVVLDIFALQLINYRLEKNKLTDEDTSVRFRLRIQTCCNMEMNKVNQSNCVTYKLCSMKV